MDVFFHASLALKSLRRRGLRSWMTLLGIFIGIAAVVSLISLGNGLEQAIMGQFSTLDADKLIIQNSGTGFGPPGSTAIRKLTEHDLKLVEQVQGIKMAVPRLIRAVYIEYDNLRKFTYIGDIPEEKEKIELIIDSWNIKMKEGKFLSASDNGKVVIGRDIAENFFSKEINAGEKVIIQGRTFEILGILNPSGTSMLNAIILAPTKDVKELLKINDEFDMMVVQLEKYADSKETAGRIEKVLRKDRNQKQGEEDFSVQTPLQALQAVGTILSIISIIITSIASISLVVGGIGIANTMYTSVLERTKEIGIMKSVGARNKDILLIFLIESGLLGLTGGIIGAIAGLMLAFAVSFIANQALNQEIIKVELSIPLLLLAVSFSLITGIISGILPALQASKLKPTEALRK